MIRLNLLHNHFGVASSKDSANVDLLGDVTTTNLGAIPNGNAKRIVSVVGALVAVGILGGGGWYLFRPTPDTTLVPETVTVEKPLRKDTTKTVKPVAKDSVKTKDHKLPPPPKPVDPPKPKLAPKPESTPQPEPAPKPEPEPEAQKQAPSPPVSESVSIQPAVVAPALAGGVVDLVLGETKSSGLHTSTPSSFEDQSPLSRLAYQRFAFERILSVIRQVTPPDMRYSSIKILSPGIVTLQGTSKDAAAIASLVQGLLAQSLVDTALVKNANGQFALMARLPFSASFGGSEENTGDFKKTITQVRDLAATQGLDLAKPSAPTLQDASGFQRARWNLSGTGAWEAVSKWISALQSTKCPIGFTSLHLTSGSDGKLRLNADAISYDK